MTTLPPLPAPDHGFHAMTGYTADQMRAYGAACAAAVVFAERAHGIGEAA